MTSHRLSLEGIAARFRSAADITLAALIGPTTGPITIPSTPADAPDTPDRKSAGVEAPTNPVTSTRTTEGARFKCWSPGCGEATVAPSVYCSTHKPDVPVVNDPDDDPANVPYCRVCHEWHADGDDGRCQMCRAAIEDLQVAPIEDPDEKRRWLDAPTGCCSCGTGGPYVRGSKPQVTRYLYVGACGEPTDRPDWSSCSQHPLTELAPIVDYGTDVIRTFRETEADTAAALASRDRGDR